jgi:dTDP-4-amino-4,6-dideoxygalactose transaminase
MMHNAHIFYCVFENRPYRDFFIAALGKCSVSSVFHYAALHLSPMGTKFGRTVGDMTHTSQAAECLARLPSWYGLEKYLDHVLEVEIAAIHQAHACTGL